MFFSFFFCVIFGVGWELGHVVSLAAPVCLPAGSAAVGCSPLFERRQFLSTSSLANYVRTFLVRRFYCLKIGQYCTGHRSQVQ